VHKLHVSHILSSMSHFQLDHAKFDLRMSAFLKACVGVGDGLDCVPARSTAAAPKLLNAVPTAALQLDSYDPPSDLLHLPSPTKRKILSHRPPYVTGVRVRDAPRPSVSTKKVSIPIKPADAQPWCKGPAKACDMFRDEECLPVTAPLHSTATASLCKQENGDSASGSALRLFISSGFCTLFL
jgi:hypothetical protein